MKLKTVTIVFVVNCVIVTAGSSLSKRRNLRRNMKSDNVMDVEDFSVYYNIDTNQTIRDLMPRPWYKPGWFLRLPFTGGKCKCEGLKCACCTGIRINAFNFDRITCALLAYEPTESTIDLDVQMNNESVYKNTFSARNPPPFCVPIVVPYLPPGLVDMCIRLFDVAIVQQKLHVCMDMDTRIDMAPVLILHFDCMDMGFNGVSLSKPGGTQPHTDETATAEPGQEDSDVYDTVTENSLPTTPMFNISIKYI